MHNTDDHEADALPQAQGKGEPIKELTLSAFLDANASDSIEGFESMDPLADPQPARFYRPAMGKVLIHTEKRGPAFEPKCQRCGGNGTLCLAPGGDPSNAHDVPCLMCVVLPEDQDEAEARAEAEYRLAFHDGILSFIVQGVR